MSQWAPIIGVKNIAKLFDVHPRTIYAWVKKKEFPLSYLPSGVRITTPSLIDAWLMAVRDVKKANPYQATMRARNSNGRYEQRNQNDRRAD